MSDIGSAAKQIIGSALGLGGLLWLGLQVDPRKFPPPAVGTRMWEETDLPSTLPQPLHDYFQATLGRTIPRIDTAFIRGRTRFRVGPVWLPVRSQTYYAPGQFYRHLVATWFGLPVFKTNESHLAGVGRHRFQDGLPNKTASRCGLCLDAWSEMIWLPPVLVTDQRLRWEAVDRHTGRLHLPFRNWPASLRLHFDPQTGLLRRLTGHRPRGRAGDLKPYQVTCSRWRTVQGMTIPTRLTFYWADESWPRWIRTMEDAYYNIDVSAQIPFVHAQEAEADPPSDGWLKSLKALALTVRPFFKPLQTTSPEKG